MEGQDAAKLLARFERAFGRERCANPISGRLLRAAAQALLLMFALGSAAALHAQSAEKPQAGRYSLLYSFQCSPDGLYPKAGLIRDSSGNLYGWTYSGGQYGNGTIFKVTPEGSETVLHSFAGAPSDGSGPMGSLALDAAGNLYGTTYSGGEFGWGTVFKLTPTGTESVLYSFCTNSNGCTDGADGGGTYGCGAVFKYTP